MTLYEEPQYRNPRHSVFPRAQYYCKRETSKKPLNIITAGDWKTQIPQKSLRVTYRMHKAELLSWNGTWVETVASRMGKTRVE